MKYLKILMVMMILNNCVGINIFAPLTSEQQYFKNYDQHLLYDYCRYEIRAPMMQKKFCMPAFHCYERLEDYCIEHAKKACHPEARLDERVIETCNYWRTKYNLFPNYKPPTQEELDKYNLFK